MKHVRLDPICDVRHCDGPRPYNARLCMRCDTRLPAYLRVAISSAHDERRGNDWRDACTAAAAYLNLKPRSIAAPAPPLTPAPAPAPAPPAPARPSIPPEVTYAMNARRMGEAD